MNAMMRRLRRLEARISPTEDPEAGHVRAGLTPEYAS